MENKERTYLLSEYGIFDLSFGMIQPMNNPSTLREALLTIVQDGEQYTEETIDKAIDAVIAVLPSDKELERALGYHTYEYPSESEYVKGQANAIRVVRSYLSSAKGGKQ